MVELEKKDEYLEEVLEKEFCKDMQLLTEQLNKNLPQIREDFKNILNDLFKDCYELQCVGEKGDIEYLHICYLLSSCLTKSHKVQFALYDKTFYLDRVEVSKLWDPEFIFKFYEQEMDYYQNKAKLDVIHFGYSDMQHTRLKYYELYYQVLGEILQFLLEDINNLEYFIKLKKTDRFSIIYSKYMAQGIKLDIGK